MKETKPAARRQLWISALFILMGIAVFMLVFYLYRHTFSRQRWLADPPYRRYMLADLERRHPMVGMSMEEVSALLGGEDSSQSSFKLSGKTYPPETTLVYYVGTDRLEEMWLILSFEDGICTAITVDVT